MKRRNIQLIAVAVLIGGPLLANALASHLPGRAPLQPIELTPPQEQAADPMAMLPKPMDAPAPVMPKTDGGQVPMSINGPTLSTEPLLDTSGMSVTPADQTLPGAAQGQAPVAPTAPAAMGTSMPQIAAPFASGQAAPHSLPSSAKQFREGTEQR